MPDNRPLFSIAGLQRKDRNRGTLRSSPAAPESDGAGAPKNFVERPSYF
jgi:hypothetical protein